MPYSPVRNATSALAEIAKVQAVPRDHRPLRLPTFPSIERTSTLAFTATAQLAVPSSGQTKVILRRDPLYPLWYQTTTSAAGSCWARDNAVGLTPATQNSLPTLVGDTVDFSALVSPPVEYTFSSSLVNPYYVNQPVAQDDKGRVWFYCGTGLTPFVHVVTSLGNFTGWTGVLKVEYTPNFSTTNPREAYFSSNMYSTTQMIFQGTGTVGGVAGWWRPLTVTCATVGATSPYTIISIMYGSMTGGFPALPTIPAATTLGPYFTPLIANPPELSVAPSVYKDTRVNALAVLFSNATAVLSKEGTIEAVRLRSDQGDVLDWDLALPGTGGMSNLSREIAGSERYYGLMEKGLYSFTLPDQQSSEFRCSVFGSVPVVRLDSAAYIQVVNFVDFSSPASNFALTVDYHVEFRNTTMLWQIGMSTVPLEDWHKAQIALLKIPCFHENPAHLATIAALARSAALAMAPLAKPAARMAIAYAQKKAVEKAQQVVSNAFKPKLSAPRQVVLRGNTNRKVGPRRVGKKQRK